MMSKVLKVLAVPVVLGFASLRVSCMSGDKAEVLLSPQQLSIYSALPQERLHYSEEHPGTLQSSLGKIRGRLQSCLQKMESAYVTVKVTAVNLYHGGEDVYHFLKDPPSGFIPRLSVIAVSGLTGVILARKGSYLKRLALPMSLTTAAFAVCCPVQTIAMLKVSGKKIYTTSQWTSSTIALLWKHDSLPAVPANSEAVPVSELPQTSGPEDIFHEAQHPLESWSSFIPDDHDRVPASFSVPQSSTYSGGDELSRMNVEEKLSTALSLTAESQPEMPPSQSSEVLQTHAAILERQKHEADLNLMDYGQSSPEDNDLYSTRS